MHEMREMFSPDHAASQSWPVRLDARLKTLAALMMILVIIASARLAAPLASLALCLIVSLASRAPLGLMLRRLIAPIAFGVMICLLRFFLTNGTLIEAATFGLRVVASAGIIVLLCALTPLDRIMAVFRWLGVPRTCTSIATLMYRYVFVLYEQAASVRIAQKMRLGYNGLQRCFSSAGSLAGIVMLRTLDQADRTHQAMLARGYRGDLPASPLPPLRRGQFAAMVLIVVGAAVCVVGERWLP